MWGQERTLREMYGSVGKNGRQCGVWEVEGWSELTVGVKNL